MNQRKLLFQLRRATRLYHYESTRRSSVGYAFLRAHEFRIPVGNAATSASDDLRHSFLPYICPSFSYIIVRHIFCYLLSFVVISSGRWLYLFVGGGYQNHAALLEHFFFDMM